MPSLCQEQARNDGCQDDSPSGGLVSNEGPRTDAIAPVVAGAVLVQDENLAGAVARDPEPALGVPCEADGPEAAVGAVGQVRSREHINGSRHAVVSGGGLARVLVERDRGNAVASGVLAVPCVEVVSKLARREKAKRRGGAYSCREMRGTHWTHPG